LLNLVNKQVRDDEKLIWFLHVVVGGSDGFIQILTDYKLLSLEIYGNKEVISLPVEHHISVVKNTSTSFFFGERILYDFRNTAGKLQVSLKQEEVEEFELALQVAGVKR
jgi:hypothetical protein